MELLTPGVGLIFWQTVIFLSLVFLLSKFAWKPILSALRIREESIEEALSLAEEARKEIANLKSDNEKLLDQARQEREAIMREAREAANVMREEARTEAGKTTEKMISDARAAIEAEKQAAMSDVRNQVTELSLVIAEKILKTQLAGNKEQEKLITEYVKELNLN